MSSLISSVDIYEVEETAVKGIGEKTEPLKLSISDFSSPPYTLIKYPESGLGVVEICIEDKFDKDNNRRFRIAKMDLTDLVKAWM